MRQETTDSLLSYAAGGTGIAFATLAQITSIAQLVLLLLSVVVISIKAIHDAVKLWRYLKNK